MIESNPSGVCGKRQRATGLTLTLLAHGRAHSALAM